jgi:hypothetical protein
LRWLGWTLVGVGAAGVLGLALWARKLVGGSVTGGDDRVDGSGVVPGDPEKLARAAGATLDEYALARCMESEESSEPARTAIGWTVRNAATRQSISIASLLLRGNTLSKGKFGAQSTGKWAATSKPPTSATLALAKKVMSKQVPDPTGGATQWDAPKAQAALHARDPGKYKTPEEIAQIRQAAGSVMVMVPGVLSTRFWKPKGAK